MTAVNDVISQYLRDQERPGDMELDAAYQLQMHVIRSMLGLLEDALAGEGVPPATAERVVRRMLTGSPFPDEGEARDRIRGSEKALKELMTVPVPVDAASVLGLPPR